MDRRNMLKMSAGTMIALGASSCAALNRSAIFEEPEKKKPEFKFPPALFTPGPPPSFPKSFNGRILWSWRADSGKLPQYDETNVWVGPGPDNWKNLAYEGMIEINKLPSGHHALRVCNQSRLNTTIGAPFGTKLRPGTKVEVIAAVATDKSDQGPVARVGVDFTKKKHTSALYTEDYDGISSFGFAKKTEQKWDKLKLSAMNEFDVERTIGDRDTPKEYRFNKGWVQFLSDDTGYWQNDHYKLATGDAWLAWVVSIAEE